MCICSKLIVTGLLLYYELNITIYIILNIAKNKCFKSELNYKSLAQLVVSIEKYIIYLQTNNWVIKHTKNIVYGSGRSNVVQLSTIHKF